MATQKSPPPALFLAALNGELEEVKRLLALPGVDVDECNEIGHTPLHATCIKGHTDIVKLLLDKGANPNRTDKVGATPLHFGCLTSQSDIVRLLLECSAIDVNIQTKQRRRFLYSFRYDYYSRYYLDYRLLSPGLTPLHLACMRGSFDVVQNLLSAPGINVDIKDARGRTPVMVATGNYRILALLEKCMKCCDDFPVHTITKVVLCGNTGAGKSTLAQIILNWPSLIDPERDIQALEDAIRKVKPLTAGILSYYVPRSDGSIMLYDLAGHLEYYSSHSSCLEAVSKSTPSTFLTLADISAELEDLKTQLNYWSAMIGNVCSKCPQPSEVIVIGTHTDEVKDKAELSIRCSLLQRHAEEAVKKTKQHFTGFISLDARECQSADMKSFICQLLETNEVVRKRCPAISLKCHVLYALLKEKVPSDRAAITLSDILQLLGTEKDHGLSTNISEITSYLTTLSDKGLILFFTNAVNPSDSCIVLKSDVLLEKVNGSLFAPASFKEFRKCLVSNTGIVPISKLQEIFPEYDIKMIVQFLFHCELCQPVVDTTDTSKTLSNCVFFPCLVSVAQPNNAIIHPNSFVWQMHTSSESEFFTPRCLHALMHRLADRFALPSEEFKHNKEIHCFSRKCEAWSRGITWMDKFAIRFVVEMDKSLQCLSFAVSTKSNKKNPQYPKQHKCVLDVIKKCCEDFCPSVAENMKERIRCPSLPCLGPSRTEVELHLLREAVSSISTESYTVVDISGNEEIDLNEWLQVEPQLPLLIGVSIKEGTPSSSPEPELKVLLDAVAAKIPAKWRCLGIQLSVPVADLDDIQLQVANRPNSSIAALELMLGKWQSRSPLTYTWSTIIGALEAPSVGENVLAAELRTRYMP